MDLKKLKILRLAIQTGSFTKAANELNYTPSAIVHMMNSLEEEIGFPILERGKSGVSLNPLGEKVFPFIHALLSSEEQLIQSIQNIEELKTGNITIGSYPSIACSYLPQVIKKFNNDYPFIEVEIIEGIRQELTAWLEDRTIDLAFFSSMPQMDYEWKPLFSDPMVAVVPLSHPLAKAEFFPIERLNSEPIIMTANGNDEDVMQIFNQYSITPNIKYITQENQTAILMVESELGISVMNKLITAKILANVAIIPLHPSLEIKLGIATPKLVALSPASAKFMEYSLDALRAL